jgi:MEMO1 family protein
MQPLSVRPPAVAGRFYPGRAETLSRDVDQYLAPQAAAPETIEGALGCIVPHAGYMYSGAVAGAVYRRLPTRRSYIILGPNHTGRGAPLAAMSTGSWKTPLGDVPIDATLAKAVKQACHLVMDDAAAHAHEHSLEVQLPFLQRRAGDFRFFPIAVGVGGFASLEALGRGLAQAARSSPEPLLVVASSDMNHYEPDGITRLKDRKAIDKILDLDPKGLYDVIRNEDISMCGYGPAIAMLTFARELGATQAELIQYATSGDVSGDRFQVVGYAGMVVSK